MSAGVVQVSLQRIGGPKGPDASTDPARQAGKAFSGRNQEGGAGERAGGDQQDDSREGAGAREQEGLS
jgi:hypothetical protein